MLIILSGIATALGGKRERGNHLPQFDREALVSEAKNLAIEQAKEALINRTSTEAYNNAIQAVKSHDDKPGAPELIYVPDGVCGLELNSLATLFEGNGGRIVHPFPVESLEVFHSHQCRVAALLRAMQLMTSRAVPVLEPVPDKGSMYKTNLAPTAKQAISTPPQRQVQLGSVSGDESIYISNSSAPPDIVKSSIASYTPDTNTPDTNSTSDEVRDIHSIATHKEKDPREKSISTPHQGRRINIAKTGTGTESSAGHNANGLENLDTSVEEVSNDELVVAVSCAGAAVLMGGLVAVPFLRNSYQRRQSGRELMERSDRYLSEWRTFVPYGDNYADPLDIPSVGNGEVTPSLNDEQYEFQIGNDFWC